MLIYLKRLLSSTKELCPILKDHVVASIKSGRGGDGNKFTGGIGGKGGSVYVVGDNKMCSLKTLSKVVSLPGSHSKYKCTVGIPGRDFTINVPLGTELLHGSELLGEIKYNGQKVLIAEGGEGGNVKNGFAGKAGTRRAISFNYKFIGDLALVGFPNAGKSTLLSAITRAKPRIADYPFTTICPQMGVVEFADGRELVVADLPGLVEDEMAAHFLGMAPQQRFLKHLSRVKVILHVVDIGGFRLHENSKYYSAVETMLLAEKVIGEFDDSFLKKPRFLVVNKIDTDPEFVRREKLLEFVRGMPESFMGVEESLRPKTEFAFKEVFEICGKSGGGTKELMKCVRRLIDEIYCVSDSLHHQLLELQLKEHNVTKLV